MDFDWKATCAPSEPDADALNNHLAINIAVKVAGSCVSIASIGDR
jgi:hypothetical protein